MSSIIITGATGLAGSGVLKFLLASESVARVTALTRSPLPEHPKLKSLIHKDFANYQSIASDLQGHDACFWCLGISQYSVSKEQYVTITHTYAIEGMKAMLEANPSNFTFCFLSGRGSNMDESKALGYFGKIKGRTEKDLQEIASGKVFSFRPGMIYNPEPPASAGRLIRAFNPIASFTINHTSNFGCSVEEIGKAMLKVAREGSDQYILENADIRQIAKDI